MNDGEGLLQVRARRTHPAPVHAAGPSASARGFDLWRIRGRKRLDGAGDAILSTSIGTHHVRILLDPGLQDGSAYIRTVPLTAQLRGQLGEFQAIAALLDGAPLAHSPARPVSRAGLLHLRALQALDAAQARASHRDLAIALFGFPAVHAQWHADGGLRAQVRHLIARAEGLMQRGYLGLAGLRHEDTGAPGDEPMR